MRQKNGSKRKRRSVTLGEALEARRLLSSANIFLDPAIDLPGPSAGAVAVRPGVQAKAGDAPGPELAPPVNSTIEGVFFEEEGALNGFPGAGSIPPDPHGAAGPNYVVHAVNSAIKFQTKSGSQTFAASLVDFFGVAATAQSDLFDPRVMYDHFSGRWIVAALDRSDTSEGAGSNTSRLYVAASDDADPNGTWIVRSINTSITIGGQASWADFTSVGFDDEAIYVSTPQFRYGTQAYAGHRLQIIDKAQLYAGTLSFTTNDILTLTGRDVSAGAFGVQPAIMFGAQPAGVGTYFVNAAGWQDGGGNDFMLVLRVDNPITAPTFTSSFVSQGGNVDNPATPLPGAPQSGTAITVRTNDRRISANAVWRDNNLYFANNSLPLTGADAGQVTVRWFRVSAPGTGAVALGDTGTIGGEELGAGAHTFFPAVAVDAAGSLAVGFSVSGPTMFPSAAYTMRLATEPTGTTQPAVIFAAGQAFYSRTYFLPANQSSLNRWGDYTSMTLDPANGTFWAFNQYALTQGATIQGESGRWGTRFANFGTATGDVAGPKVTASAFNFLTGHSIAITFNEDVSASLTTADLLLENLTTSSTVPTGALLLNYNTGTNTATITFPGVAGPPAGILADGNYRLTLDADGITDAAGNKLDGNGDGINGDDFPFNFFVLAGDANRSRAVNLDDFTVLAANFGLSPRNFEQGDFNYSGAVSLDDFTILAANFGASLPSSLPRNTAAAAGSPFSLLRIDESMIENVLSELPA